MGVINCYCSPLIKKYTNPPIAILDVCQPLLLSAADRVLIWLWKGPSGDIFSHISTLNNKNDKSATQKYTPKKVLLWKGALLAWMIDYSK